MRRICMALMVFALSSAWAAPASAQESMAAKTTRKKLQKPIDVEQKEIGTKDFLEDVLGEIEVKFIIDNGSGVSNNTKMTYKAKGVTAEKMLNDLADKYDWGWYVVSDVSNNKYDGKVKIRKSSKGKERGYEAGKEPKKTSADVDVLPLFAPVDRTIAAFDHSRFPIALIDVYPTIGRHSFQ